MKYCIADAGFPMSYISAGNLISEDGFVHSHRKIDSFVFILVQEGTLFLTQEDSSFEVHPNEFLLLFPGMTHFGTRPSSGRLSYYWTHFSSTDPNFHIYNERTLPITGKETAHNPASPDAPGQEYFLLPEYGTLSSDKRSTLLFIQLLDISKRENFRSSWRCNYALSTLLMELTYEAQAIGLPKNNRIPNRILEIAEWIRTHYEYPLSAESLSIRFGYHPTYLSALFKQHTGYPLLSYINRTRINAAKNLLSAGSVPVSRIAASCGFSDEKHFFKLFKRYEGMTPSQYRRAFHQKMVNIR